MGPKRPIMQGGPTKALQQLDSKQCYGLNTLNGRLNLNFANIKNYGLCIKFLRIRHLES